MEDQMAIAFVHNTVEYSNYIVADRIPVITRQSSRLGFGMYYYNLRTKQWLCDSAERFIQRYVDDTMTAYRT